MFDVFFKWYLWYFLFLVFMGFVYVQQKDKYLSSEEGKLLKSDDYRVSLIFSLLVFLPLMIISGLREQYSVGDTWLYVEMYKSYPSSLSELLGDLDWEGRYPGFLIFSVLVKQFFGSDYRAWLMIIAIISCGCLAITYRKYTSDIVTTAFLFFASTDFMSWMMNGMRQFLVATIVFAFFPLLKNKKYVFFIILVLILFTVHRSAIVVIPLYLCSLGKPFNKRTFTVLGLCLVAIIFVGQFTNMLDDSLQTTAYSGMVEEFEGDNGTNIVRALVYSIPAIIAIFSRKKFTEETPSIIQISVNMSLITMGMYFLSVFTSGIYMGRLPIYFSLFNYILLPWELKNLFTEDQHKFLRATMVVLYLVFFTYQMIEWNI